MLDHGLGQAGGEPNPVSPCSLLELLVGALMGMEDDRGGLVDDLVARQKHPQHRLQILPGERRGCGAEGGVETTQPLQDFPPERHVLPAAEVAHREREQGPVRGWVGEVEYAALESPHEPAASLEPCLGRGFELARGSQPSDPTDPPVAVEGSCHPRQPVTIGNDVVIGEDDDLTAGLAQPAVARVGASGRRLGDDTDRSSAVLGEGSRVDPVLGSGGVIDDDDLEAVPGIGVGQEPRDGLGDGVGAVAGRHHHAQGRCPVEEIVELGPATGHRAPREGGRRRPGSPPGHRRPSDGA